MNILSQIKQSSLSRQGLKNTSGRFEGTPTNVALVRQGVTTPALSQTIPSIQNPVDVTNNALSSTTYLEYLKSTNRI